MAGPARRLMPSAHTLVASSIWASLALRARVVLRPAVFGAVRQVIDGRGEGGLSRLVP